MFKNKVVHIICMLVLVSGITGCATYYDKTRSTERAIVSRNYDEAESDIRKNKFLSKKRNELLYYLELGRIQNLKGEYEESNKNLNKADHMMEEYRNLFEMAVGVTVNPSLQPYKPESHEQILVHYYKALNYMQLGNTEEAIVEARRIDLTQSKNDRVAKGKWKKYGKDPFGLMLMGMIYEADRDYNNAFIAYRNAKKAYQEDETGLYKHNMPASLESDLVRTASFAGMHYDSDIEIEKMPHGEAIIFWENGMAPIKEEKNMFFSLNKENGGFFFVSDNLNIPIDYDFEANDPDFKPEDIGMIRLAWAYYIQRPYRAGSAYVSHNGKRKNLQLIEDVSALAFRIERDNYFKELGKNLLRLAIKKISELSVSEANEYAGLAMGIANAATEKADTRNWQSLPGQIHYTRVPLEKGTNNIEITCDNGETFQFEVEGTGKTVFRNVVTH